MRMKTADTRTFAIMAKPVGATCNLGCAYCYYLEKTALLGQHGVMQDAALEAYTRQTIEMHGRDALIEFAWHGGEPTLAGMAFYRKALKLQERYGQGRKVLNTLQTNATLLTDRWCAFFAGNGFLLGVSIDGDKALHDSYRMDKNGGTFDKVMGGVRLLQKHGVPFNTLTTVNAVNSAYPVEVYGFLREITDYMQFLPVVECVPAGYEQEDGQRFATPAGRLMASRNRRITGFSVSAKGYGTFLCGVYDAWRGQDLGKKHVQLFEATIGNLRGKPAGLCVHEAVCGHAAVVEANGDVYRCDRYVYPAYKLGNILETPLGTLMEQNRAFGMHKAYGLPHECLKCAYIKLCFGGCPKDRLLLSKDGQEGRNYLCEGYKIFFEHFTQK
ncbi:MAG: anaerobic sulfatase maturase [bacterium]